MSIPHINGSLLLLRVLKIAAVSCQLSAVRGRMSVQDLLLQMHKIPYPIAVDVSVTVSGLFLSLV